MNRFTRIFALALVMAAINVLPARAATLLPLESFGGGDGWRAPFEILPGDETGTDSISPGLYNYLGNAVFNLDVNIGHLERGLAYNPTTGNLILVSRNNAGGTLPSIRLLDGTTGIDIGSLDQGTGVISGGTFAVNMVGVADDGAIYVGNLTTSTSGAGGPFKVYRWADETTTPTVAYDGDPLSGARLGDTLDVIGSGIDTRLVAGYGTQGADTLSNSFALLTTADGQNFTATDISLTATPPATLPPNGDFRLGITFTDDDTVLGKATLHEAHLVDVTGATGEVTMNVATEGIGLRPMDYAVVGGRPVVAMVEATIDQTEAARARLFVYDMTDPSLPLVDRKIAEASALPFNPGGPNQFSNPNGTGQVKFGAIDGNTAIVYAMSSNNGIQAFELTLDPIVGNNGDYNGDGFVDAADYVVWRRGDGTPEGYDAWRANFGMAVLGAGGGSPTAVPEPGTLVLLAVAGLGAVCRIGRRAPGKRSK